MLLSSWQNIVFVQFCPYKKNSKRSTRNVSVQINHSTTDAHFLQLHRSNACHNIVPWEYLLETLIRQISKYYTDLISCRDIPPDTSLYLHWRPRFAILLAPVPLSIFRSNSMKIQNALVSNIFDRSQRYFAHVTTVTLSWRVQNIVVIGHLHFTLECFEFSSNFEFDRNMLSGTYDNKIRLGWKPWLLHCSFPLA